MAATEHNTANRRVGMIGLGNFGTAIGALIASNEYPLLGWDIHDSVVTAINKTHQNPRFLAGIPLPINLCASSALQDVLEADIVFVAIPTAYIAATLQPHIEQAAPTTAFVNLAKGIDRSTQLTAFQTLQQLAGGRPTALLSGPSIANEFSRGVRTRVMIASEDAELLPLISSMLNTATFTTHPSSDVIGVEWGGILKNIYAIGLGFEEARGALGINHKAAFLTQALEEMALVGEALGGQRATFYGLAGMGDLLATALSEHSHNRGFGEAFGQGESLEAIEARAGVLPEGYYTLHTVIQRAADLGLDLPLAHTIWNAMQSS